MAQIKELKIMFGTGDLANVTIEPNPIVGGWIMKFYSMSQKRDIPLEPQRIDKNAMCNYKVFKTFEAAIKDARAIGFKCHSFTSR